MSTNEENDTLRFAGDVRIDDIILISHAKTGVSLLNLFAEMNLYEDLYANTLSGDVTVVDATNLPMNESITGLDKIYFSFYTPGANSEKIELLMNVYKISERKIENDKKQIYTLHFCSVEQLQDNLRKISHGYRGIASEFVTAILQQQYGLRSTRPLEVEPTKFETACVIPRWNPLKAINWITQRSVSAISNIPDMLFFETVDGFKLKSITTMMQEETKENYIFRPAGYHNLTPGMHNYAELEKDYVNIAVFNVKATSDMIDLIQQGTFAQKLIIHDITTGEYKETDFDYFKEYAKIPNHLSGGKLIPNTPTLDEQQLNLLPESYINIVADHSKLFVPEINDTKQYQQWLPLRQSLFQQYNAVTVEFSVPGDSSRRVGDVIELFIPSLEAFEGDQYVPDKYLSGKYMIASIRHHIKRDNHQMIIDAFKDGYGEPLPDASEVPK